MQSISVKFTVRGNHKNPIGNAVPKARLTKGQQWTDKAQGYAAWKDHVRACFLDSVREHPAYSMMIRNLGLNGRPFSTTSEVQGMMQLTIRWADNTHGDPESIFGSIADALFSQDKYLGGSFGPGEITGRGEVDVAITLSEK